MKTTTRDLLSNDDIAATCGDADCATSDAEMTDADKATLAQVDAEIVASAKVALTYEEAAALPEGALVVWLSTGKTYMKHNDGHRPGRFYFQTVRNGECFGRAQDFRAGRFGKA
jgi:hypothetical protein